MKIVVGESVSYGVVFLLRNIDYDVISIAEGSSGLKDIDVFKLAQKEKAILITRDHHFINSLRFPPKDIHCIIFIRKGNLSSQKEIELIKWFIKSYSIAKFSGKLITLSKGHVKVR